MSEFILALDTAQTVSVTGTSAQSSAIGSGNAPTKGNDRIAVRLVATVDMHIIDGESPVATTSHTLLVAYQPEYIEMQRNQLLAAIRSSASGTLYITEMR